jgi:hypothetical protein
MQEHSRSLEELMKELPPHYQEEVRDFVIFLLEKWNKRPKHQPTFSWAGALKDLRDQYTSVELQHKISDWRVKEK